MFFFVCRGYIPLLCLGYLSKMGIKPISLTSIIPITCPSSFIDSQNLYFKPYHIVCDFLYCIRFIPIGNVLPLFLSIHRQKLYWESLDFLPLPDLIIRRPCCTTSLAISLSILSSVENYLHSVLYIHQLNKRTFLLDYWMIQSSKWM